MSLTRWEPLRNVLGEMDDVRRNVQRLFGDMGGNEWSLRNPPVDLYETADELVIQVDLPGVAPEDLSVQYQPGALVIRGKRATARPDGATFSRRERIEGEIACTVSLVAPIDEGRMKASQENGVLTVHLPKLEQARAKQIPVEAAR